MRSIVLGLAALLPALLASAESPAATENKHPDVLIVTVDSLRADRLGSYGHRGASTPALDALAVRGRRYTQAVTPFPRTTPAIASLLSGLWPSRHGSREVGQPMRDVPTLASLLAEAGYKTIAISSTRVLSEDQGVHRGFGSFEAKRLHAGQVTDAAIEALRPLPGEQPLLLWVHYFDPHFPYLPWPTWEQPQAQRCRALAYDLTTSRTMSWARLHGNQDGRAQAALSDCSALYDSEISFTDYHIGRLLERFEAQRASRPKIVVFTADHGENLGEAGLYYEHGPNLHEASLRVPLILAGTGIEPGREGALVSLVDVAPTVLALAGVLPSRPPLFDGRALPLRDREETGSSAPSDRVVFAESGTAFDPRFTENLASGREGGMHCVHGERYSLCIGSRDLLHLFDHDRDPAFRTDLVAERPEEVARLYPVLRAWPPETARLRAVRDERFKLIEFPQPDGTYLGKLYDLTRDPWESNDVRAAHPAVYAELQLLLAAWREDLRNESARAERDPELIEALRSLGYID